jgi:hypothetical protein
MKLTHLGLAMGIHSFLAGPEHHCFMPEGMIGIIYVESIFQIGIGTDVFAFA